VNVATYCTQLSLFFQLIAMQWCVCDIFVSVLKLYCSRHPAVTFTDTSNRQIQCVGQTFSSHFSAFQNQFLLTRDLHTHPSLMCRIPVSIVFMDVRSTIFKLCASFFWPFRHHHTPVSTTNTLGTYKQNNTTKLTTNRFQCRSQCTSTYLPHWIHTNFMLWRN